MAKADPVPVANEIATEVDKVAKLTAACLSVDIAEKGAIYVNFADGTQLEFADVQQMREFVAVTITPSVLQAMHCARLLADSPDLVKVDAVQNKTISIDLVDTAAAVKVA